MILCTKMGFTLLCFEGNCLVVVNAVRGVNVDDKVLGSIIFDIQQLLSSHLDWKITFVPRESNIVAHVLAKLSCTLLTETVWLEEYPMQIVRRY